MKEIIVIGGGGHARVIIDAIRLEGFFTIKGIIDPAFPKGSKIEGIDVLGNDDVLKDLYVSGIHHAFIGVGTIGRYEIKRSICKRLKEEGFILPVVRHPSSIIASDVVIGPGTFIAAGAVINTGAVIGENAIINTRASIDHDCRIGDLVHISPGVTLCGDVNIGREVHIGAGSVVVQNIRIAEQAFVKAGTVVIKDIEGTHA